MVLDGKSEEILKQAKAGRMVALCGKTGDRDRTHLAASIISISEKKCRTECARAESNGLSKIVTCIRRGHKVQEYLALQFRKAFARYINVFWTLPTLSSWQFATYMLKNASPRSDTMNPIIYKLAGSSKEPLQAFRFQMKAKVSDTKRFFEMEVD